MHSKSKRCSSPNYKNSNAAYAKKYAGKPTEETQVSETSQLCGDFQKVKSKKRFGARRLKKQKAGRLKKLAQERRAQTLTPSLALTPYQSEQVPVRSQLLTSATSRGRSTTFWADLNQTYFQSVDLPLANLHWKQLKLATRPPALNPHATEPMGKLGENFSLYDYFQDVLAPGMQDLVLTTDAEEVDLLRKVFVVDQHLVFRDTHSNTQHLLGHSLSPVQSNPKFSTDFFEAQDGQGNAQTQDLDSHLEWLSKELAITQRQVSANYDQLLGKIQAQAQKECSQSRLVQNQCNILSRFFVRNIMHMEMLQLAESIQLVKATRQVSDSEPDLPAPAYFKEVMAKTQENDTNTTQQYLLSFDKSLNLADVWVSPQQLDCFNQLRGEMANRLVKPRVVDDNHIEQETLTVNAQAYLTEEESDELDYIARDERIRGFDMDQLEYCHHCMQLKQAQIHVRCRYQSSKHRVNTPASLHVNGIKVFNAETYKPDLASSLILKKLIKDKKRRHNVEKSLEITCSKQFCSFCLKNFYDTNFSTIRKDPNWCCPHCMGQCYCSRCRRQEQMVTAKGYLISLNQKELLSSPSRASALLGLAFPALVSSTHPIDVWIKQNFELFVRTCDLSNKQQREPPAAFIEHSVSTQQHIIQLTRKPLVQNHYEPVLRKRLRCEVSKFIQGLNVENIHNQNENRRLVRDIRQATRTALTPSPEESE